MWTLNQPVIDEGMIQLLTYLEHITDVVDDCIIHDDMSVQGKQVTTVFLKWATLVVEDIHQSLDILWKFNLGAVKMVMVLSVVGQYLAT